MDNLRSTITTKILSNIPPRVKPIDYLMETLDISRESVYRRIRGDISFTLEEIAKLSVDLGFSVDELIIADMHSRVFFDLHVTNEQDPSEIFLTMFQQYFFCVFNTLQVKNIESTMILNHIPSEFVIFFDHLFKFSYYRWMHQNQEASLKYFYADVALPDKLLRFKQSAIENMKKIQMNTIIFDPNIFYNLNQEILYYHKRRLINEEEFSQLKDDLFKLIDLSENVAQTGYCKVIDTRYNLYLSSLNIESSSRYVRCDERSRSQFFVSSLEPLSVTNPTLCAIHKKWLDSMRKYATLITQSNEILQVRYFNKQRSLINENSETLYAVSL